MTETINLSQTIRDIKAGKADVQVVYLGEDEIWRKNHYPIAITTENMDGILNPESDQFDLLAYQVFFLKAMFYDIRDDVRYDLKRFKADCANVIVIDDKTLMSAFETYGRSQHSEALALEMETILGHYENSIMTYKKPIKGSFEDSLLCYLGVDGGFASEYDTLSLPEDVEMLSLNGVLFDKDYGKPQNAMPYPILTDLSIKDEVKAIFNAKGMMLDDNAFKVDEVIVFRENWQNPTDTKSLYDLLKTVS